MGGVEPRREQVADPCKEKLGVARYGSVRIAVVTATSGVTKKTASQPSMIASPAWAASASDSRRVIRRIRSGVLRSNPYTHSGKFSGF